MPMEEEAVRDLVEKDRIRDPVGLYSRAIDRKDVPLLRTLYTDDGTDTHGDTFDGPADAHCDFVERSLPYMRYSGHHVCNHLIAPDGDDAADGEADAIAAHVVPDGSGGWVEDLIWVRYIDRYRKGADGLWRFARRGVTYDHRTRTPVAPTAPDPGNGGGDPSYMALAARLFARGPRG